MKKLLFLLLAIIAGTSNAQTIATPSQPKIIYVQYASHDCPRGFCQLVYFKYWDGYDASYDHYEVFVPNALLNDAPDHFTYDETSSGHATNFYAHENANNQNVELKFIGYARKNYNPLQGQQMINYDEVTNALLKI